MKNIHSINQFVKLNENRGKKVDKVFIIHTYI